MTVPERHAGASRFNRYSNALDASANASRIRELSIYDNAGGNDMRRLIEIFSRPFPNLTRLRLVLYRLHHHISLPDSFGSNFPKLRKLEVRGVVAWPEVVGANLTHIIIHNSFDSAQLKRCVPYSPRLEALKIRVIEDPDQLGLDGTSERIALPSGIRLAIKD